MIAINELIVDLNNSFYKGYSKCLKLLLYDDYNFSMLFEKIFIYAFILTCYYIELFILRRTLSPIDIY